MWRLPCQNNVRLAPALRALSDPHVFLRPTMKSLRVLGLHLGRPAPVGVSLASAASAPASANSPLRASADGRFLVREDGQPFFWLGDTAWELFGKLTREEVDEYLDARRTQKFTVLQAI